MKAIIYGRVSTQTQETIRQIYDLEELAKSQGYTIVKSFEENITGTSIAREREAFSKMLIYIKEHDIKQVYAWELSRLGRTTIDIHRTVEAFREANINVHIKVNSINTNRKDASSDLLLGTLANLAAYELSSIKSRTMSGMANSIRHSGVGSGCIKQFGYKKDNGRLIIDEEEATIIREMIDLYLTKDWSLADIANHLNNIGVETRYKKLIDSGAIKRTVPKLIWFDYIVGRIFHRKLLTGFRKHGDTEIQLENLRIIDNATFEALQTKMAAKRQNLANAAKYENILKGKLICGHCGATMTMAKGKTGISNHYKCFNKFKLKENCTEAKMINIDLLNNVVYQLTKNFKVDSLAVLGKIKANKEKLQQNQNTLNQIDNDIKGLLKQIDKAYAAYDVDAITIIEYKEKRANYEASIVIEEAKKEVVKVNNDKLNAEINHYNNTKTVDLTNPSIFKANISMQVENIKVSVMDLNKPIGRAVKLVNYKLTDNSIQPNYNAESATVYPTGKRDIIYRIEVNMIDGSTSYVLHVNNMQNNINKIITVERK